MRRHFSLVLILVLAACGPRATTPTAPEPGRPVTAAPTEFAGMLERVNQVRASGYDCGSGGRFSAAPPLGWNTKLAGAALDHSQDMLKNNLFSHTGSDGSSVSARAERRGYDWMLIGENLAYATPGHFGQVSVVDAWLGSPGHCANLMNAEFRELGAAKVSGELEFWTQVFGTPR